MGRRMAAVFGVAVVLAAAGWAEENPNLLADPGFEAGGDAWHKDISHDAKVAWEFVASPAHAGGQALQVTNATPQAPHVYGTIWQTVKIKPGATYELSLWLKTENAYNVWFGGGKDWRVRKSCPAGSYDWKRVTLVYRTESDENEFTFRINFDGLAQKAWIDDVAMVEVEPEALTSVLTLDDLGGLSFLPVLPAGAAIKVDGDLGEWGGFAGAKLPASAEQVDLAKWAGPTDLSYTVKAAWDEANLYLAVEVTDDVHDATFGGGMWTKDSIQLAFGAGSKYGPEYGFSLAEGKADVHKWQDGANTTGADKVVLATSEAPGVVRYEIALPWTCAFAARPEREFRFDLIVNDSDGQGRRGWIGWTPGIGNGKDASRFVRARLCAEGAQNAVDLAVDNAEPLKDQKVVCGLAVANWGAADLAGKAALPIGQKSFKAPAGSVLTLNFPWLAAQPGEQVIAARLTGDLEQAVECAVKVLDYSAADVEARLAGLDKELAELDGLLAQCREKKIPVEYETADATVIRNFIGFGRDDLAAGQLRRAQYTADELTSLAKRTRENLTLYLNGQRQALAVSRYVTGKIEIQDYGFVADVRDPLTGQTSRRPVNFLGYGHFGQVRKDIPQFQAYGVNMIQFEIGPSGTVLAPEKEGQDYRIDTKGIETKIIPFLKQAEENNIAVNVLLSPHYFPAWALKKWPELNDYSGGFLKYTIDAPQARMVVEAFLRTIIPLIKDYKSLHSLCLSNEPVYKDCRKDRYSQQLWKEYLEKKYVEIAKLNAVYASQYADFAAVPIPNNAEVQATPYFCDYARFNMDRFAAWHKWMADIIHEMAPEIPVHAKIMNEAFSRALVGNGVDPELICGLSQINGCDNWCYYNGHYSPYLNKLDFYDLMASFKRAPIYNSEDHIIPDCDKRYIPEQAVHLRTDLWQGAIHGRSASTIWVWERTKDPKSDLNDSVIYRPDCAAMVGRTNLDLNRLAFEVKALQDAPFTARILYSLPSLVLSSVNDAAVKGVYAALSFSGCKVGFVSETQVAAADLKPEQVVVVPASSNAAPATLEKLADFAAAGGKVVLIGEDCLLRDSENRPLAADRRAALLAKAIAVKMSTDPEELRGLLAPVLREAGLNQVELITADTGQPAWGVEWRSTEREGHRLVNLVNYTSQAVNVKLLCAGQPVTQFRERITEKDLSFESLRLEPLTPWLIEF